MSKKKPYEILLERHDKLAQGNKLDIFDRAGLLSHVFDDPQFTKDLLAKKENPLDELNKRVADTCANFMELYQMRKMFPRKAQWASGNLADMRRQMIDSLSRQGGEKKKKKVTRHVITQSEYEKLKEENKILKNEIAHLKSELALARETIDILKGQTQRQVG